MRVAVLFAFLLAQALAAPFIGVKDQSPRLSRFLQTEFCRFYGCVFQARVVDNPGLNVVLHDFGLPRVDGAVQVETLDGEVIGLELNLAGRKSLSRQDLDLMAAVVTLASGRKPAYDYARACQQNQPGRPQDAGKIGGFLFQINCYRFPGIVEGTWEYNLKAWLPG